MPPSTVSILTSKSATRCRVVPAFPRIFLCICAGALFYERAWSRNARGAGKPQHKQAPRREKSLRRFWSRRRDYLRLYGQVESRGFYERLDGFATAGVRSREPTAENKASHFQTFRRLWFKPLTTAKTPRRQKCHLGVLVEATGFAPLAARPRRSKACFAGICLWQTPRCLRLLLLFPQIFCFAKPLRESSIICLPGCSVCAHPICFRAIRAQTARSPLAPPPSNTVDVRENGKESRRKSALFPVVEATGFEPTTSWSRTKRATKLRYASNGEYYIKPGTLLQAILSRCNENPARRERGKVRKTIRGGPVSRVLSSAVIYLRPPSPTGSSVIHGSARTGSP